MNSVSWLCQAGISLEDTNTNESSIEWEWLEYFNFSIAQIHYLLALVRGPFK